MATVPPCEVMKSRASASSALESESTRTRVYPLIHSTGERESCLPVRGCAEVKGVRMRNTATSRNPTRNIWIKTSKSASDPPSGAAGDRGELQLIEPAFRATHLRVSVSRPQNLALHDPDKTVKTLELKGDLEPSKLSLSILMNPPKCLLKSFAREFAGLWSAIGESRP